MKTFSSHIIPVDVAVPMTKAIFLDRDGVINIDKGYVHRWEDFEFIEGSIKAMQKLTRAGYQLIIVTNQSGIARGFFSEQDYYQLTVKMVSHLKRYGVMLLDILYCPHHPRAINTRYAVECTCRKPKPGMILNALKRHKIDPAVSILIGDKITDIQAGIAAGVRLNLLIQSRYREDSSSLLNVPVFGNLGAAADGLLGNSFEVLCGLTQGTRTSKEKGTPAKN